MTTSNPLNKTFIVDRYASGIIILKQDSDGNFKSLKMVKTKIPDGFTSYKLMSLKYLKIKPLKNTL